MDINNNNNNNAIDNMLTDLQNKFPDTGNTVSQPINPASLQKLETLLEQIIETLRQCIIVVEEYQPENQAVLNGKM